MNEWGFTGEVKSWIDRIALSHAGLPFSCARIEEVASGSRTRRDLTLLDRHGNPILTGEVKLPDAPDGGTPYHSAVVKDARKKARNAGVKFFFTWNVNECVLWETATAGAGLKDRAYERWTVAAITRRGQLDSASVQKTIRDWLVEFLHDAARIIHAGKVGGTRTPDIKFVEALESALTVPIRHTQESIAQLYGSKQTFKRELDQWMVSLGWTVVTDAQGIDELMERAAKFGCYLFVNKLVFHEALLKKYGASLEPIGVPPEITTGDALQTRMQHFFADAMQVSGGYETIFGVDRKDLGRRIPFYADAAVQGWRSLIDQIHDFDFSKLDYEVVGSIFERLIGPEERHKYGQFYTRVSVVDLINSFCIDSGDATVLDPACGGGTFLVRAYARKKVIAENRSHRDLLADLYGIDVSQFAAHLTAMNLATRDLMEDQNYPRVGRADFFDVLADSPFVRLPRKLASQGLGTTFHDIEIAQVDAVVGNPPYVRHEGIPKATVKPRDGGPEAGTKEFYNRRVRHMAGASFSGRSDLHCYFWPHAATFLKQGGMLGFITSSQWLDVEYGFHLQRWLLRNFEVLAVLDSPVEPWFIGARVGTVVTIARRCDDAARRDANTVRFVQLRKPLEALLENDGTTLGTILCADALRDDILGLTSDLSDERYRARLVNQGQLWHKGVASGAAMGRDTPANDNEEDEDGSDDVAEDADVAIPVGDYGGGKWGMYLRAPDVWFDLLDRYGDRFAPLGAFVDIRRGITSGKDDYFYPDDVTADCLAEFSDPVAFEEEYGVRRSLVSNGTIKLVMAGEQRSQIHAIESACLAPVVHSLREITGYGVRAEDCSHLIFLAPSPGNALPKFAADYVAWGEQLGIDKKKTCAQRATKDREWYDLTGRRRGIAFWPKAQQYKHAVALNTEGLQANCNLYDLFPHDSSDGKALAALLNSTLVILAKHQFGRPTGVEGILKTEVVDVAMMLVPDLRKASDDMIAALEKAMDELAQRRPLPLVSARRLRTTALQASGEHAALALLSDECELDMPDRRALDHLVLRLLGVEEDAEREHWIDALYDHVRQFAEATRGKEELAIVNRKITQRKGAVTPQILAAQIAQELRTNAPSLFKTYRDFFDESGAGDSWLAAEVSFDGHPELHVDLVDTGVRFMHGRKQLGFLLLPSEEHAALAVAAIREKRQETLQLPRAPSACRQLLQAYRSFIDGRDARLREAIADRVSDDEVQGSVLALLLQEVRRGSGVAHSPPRAGKVS